MEHSSSLTSLMIVVAIAFLVPILLAKFNLKVIPVVVAEIIAGLIVGKSGLNIISEDPWLELLSLFGFIYLMFLSGLEIDFQSFRQRKKSTNQDIHPLKPAVIITMMIFLISFIFSIGLEKIGLITESYLMTLIIATISLGVVVPVLKEKKIIETNLGQTILIVAVIADLATMILLAVYISVMSHNILDMLFLLLFFVAVFAIYFFIKKIVAGKLYLALKKGTVQIGTRAVFALILLLVVLSETLNVEIILGAFLAGVIVSLFAPNKDFAHQLESFGYGFLIPIFFLMVGVNLSLWELFTDFKIIVLIPVLLIAIFLSKLVPSLLLMRWFSFRHAAGSGLLLSSTLSLVIAAATVAYEVGIIEQTLQGALILVAVLSCVISPIFFNHIFPEVEHKKTVIAIVGANHITLPVSQDLAKEGYYTELYSTQPLHDESKEDKYSRFPLIQVEDLNIVSLTKQGVFQADVVVFGTMDDSVNINLAKHAKSLGIERIIVRVEDPDKHEELQQEEGYILLSTLYASRTLLKALIEHPSAVRLITQHDDSIQEVQMNNSKFHNVYLSELPFLGDILILRIFRGDSFIIPHGSTQIELGDRLLVSGDVEHIMSLKDYLE